jgi:hypothetical protein
VGSFHVPSGGAKTCNAAFGAFFRRFGGDTFLAGNPAYDLVSLSLSGSAFGKLSFSTPSFTELFVFFATTAAGRSTVRRLRSEQASA